MDTGTLFYVVGPSGVGKDTLIDGAKKEMNNAKVVFSHRYITRPNKPDAEQHVEISQEDFKTKIEENFFCLWWNSHENFYGIPSEIETLLKYGINVVVNGSRGYYEEAILKFPEMKTILITAKPEIIRHRLTHRGRESEEEIIKRVNRSIAFNEFTNKKGVIELSNNGEIQDAVKKLTEVLLKG